ncbi:MAG: 50S ribosomal protein L18 [Candidatus Nomurabacteria bacterium]|jgi:large subunit ribosomal protein L18|nr:50S ribosomal protein L18 [Candidatus Nomurabacteria bacterium]
MVKISNKTLRKNRVRATVSGTSARPRLSVFISNTHVSAQIIDDEKAKTLASATSVGKKLTGTMSEKAAIIGKEIGERAKKAKVKTVVFDRNGRAYAGRLKALADAARAQGLEF